MKKIFLIISLVLIFGNNYIFAENDISKLSQKDREQCLLMDELKREYSAKRSILGYSAKKRHGEKYKEDMDNFIKYTYYKRYSLFNLIVLDKKNIKRIKKIRKSRTINIFDFGLETAGSSKLLIQKGRILGITPILFAYHSDPRNFNFENYNKGYLMNIVDYYKMKGLDLSKELADYGNNLDYLIFTKEKPLSGYSYIKTKNCFVEEYYIKQEN